MKPSLKALMALQYNDTGRLFQWCAWQYFQNNIYSQYALYIYLLFTTLI